MKNEVITISAEEIGDTRESIERFYEKKLKNKKIIISIEEIGDTRESFERFCKSINKLLEIKKIRLSELNAKIIDELEQDKILGV